MSIEESKAMIRHVFEEALNQRNVAVIDALFAENAVDHSAWPGQAAGAAGTKQGITDVLNSFADLHVTIETLIAEGDQVATRETWRGTYAPTGRQATGTVMHFFRITGGKIVDEWSEGWGWLEQLGAALTTEQPAQETC
ncbi:MAG: ester cyclase [Chloroflexota bacterium]|nr:ester cyclase [Chloroflexota bacterium]